MISSEQIAYFQTFGFLGLKRAFDAAEMADIAREFDTLLNQERQGQTFPAQKRQSLYRIAELSPLLTRLVEDARIYETVEQLLGPGFIWLCSEGNLYVGDTGWHPDGTRMNYRPMKVSLYLDSICRDTGCLRVIPGSHRLPFHEEIRQVVKAGIPGPEIPSFPLESEPGDVYFMDMNIWHASFGGKPGRRHLAVNFVPEPTQEEHVTILKENYSGVLKLMDRLQYSRPGRVFTDAFLNSDSPRIRRLAFKWVELGLK